MLQHVLSLALPVLGWWLLTGIINLAFAYKSQIEAWAESNPRLASLLKLSRALGFDPWNLLSSLKLLASKKLPDAQKADSPIAKLEQKRADAKRLGIDRDPPGGSATRDELSPPPPPPSVRPMGGFDAEIRKWRHPSWKLSLLVAVVALLCLPGCAAWKPAVRTTNDVARVLCGEFFGQKMGMSLEDAAKKFCETRDDLEPWIDAVLAAKRNAAPKAEARHP